MDERSQTIESLLNTLGLLEGLCEVEREFGLTVGENLFVEPCYENLEPFHVVSAVEYDEDGGTYTVFSKVNSLPEAFYDISPDFVQKVYDFMERILNEKGTIREEVEIGRQFVTFLDRQIFYACYTIWKEGSQRLFEPFPEDLGQLPFFSPHFLDAWKSLSSSFPKYFALCKDVIMGIWLRAMLQGLDRGSWKWGTQALIERMFRGIRIREFDLEFRRRPAPSRPLDLETRATISKSALSRTCIGANALHGCGDIEIHLTTSSLQMYLDFHPEGAARRFAQQVAETWLNANLASVIGDYYRVSWKFHYTGDKVPGCLYEERMAHEGLFRLGHSFWLLT